MYFDRTHDEREQHIERGFLADQEARTQQISQVAAVAQKRRVRMLHMEGEKLVWEDDRTGKKYVAWDFDNRDVTALGQLHAAIALRDADLEQAAKERLERQELESRRAMVALTYEDMHRFFGMPDNVDVVGMHVDPRTSSIMLHVRSSEFDRVHPGTEMPIMQGSWHREYAYLVRLEDDQYRGYDPDIDKAEESVAFVRMEWSPT